MEFKIKRYCTVCGKIHEGHCKHANISVERNSQADKFRNTQVWKRTAKAILERDFHCCRVCLAAGILTNRGLSVHHIVPLVEDYERRLDESNLITLCRFCHAKAESGVIPRARLLHLASIPPEGVSFERPLAVTSDRALCKQNVP